MSLGVIVLAAGAGSRMKSALPKVLHPVCGTPMLEHVLSQAAALQPERIAVVVGFGKEQVMEALGQDAGYAFVHQDELNGTADAVRRCRDAMQGCDTIIVLNGDSPLVTSDLLRRLDATRGDAPMAMTTCRVRDSGPFGRVVRDGSGAIERVVESVSGNETGMAERNAGQYAFSARWLWEHIETVPRNPSGEYYLTYLPEAAHREGRPAVSCTADADEVMGFDDRIGLAEAERLMRTRILTDHMRAGVTIVDPTTTYIHAAVEIASDVTIQPNCYLFGATKIESGVVVGPNTTLRSATIASAAQIEASVVEDSSIGPRTRVGPFAHVRGGASIGADCELGNYAEVKNSVIGDGVKMHHFSYLGDADVGPGANIAAGAITCNYDGVSKHRTTIGAKAFIGCDTMLVAPVTIGEGAITGAGAVVTADVAPGITVVGVPARPVANDVPSKGAKKAGKKHKR